MNLAKSASDKTCVCKSKYFLVILFETPFEIKLTNFMNIQNVFVVGVCPRFDVVQNIVLFLELGHQPLHAPKLERVVETAHVDGCVLTVLRVVMNFDVCKVG